MEENTQSLSEIVKNLTQAFFKTAKDTVNLAGAEAKLSAKSLVNIVIYLMALRILAVISWLLICTVIVLTFNYFNFTWLLGFIVITAINLVLLTTIIVFMLKAKANLGFPATRRQLKGEPVTGKDYFYEPTKIEDKTS